MGSRVYVVRTMRIHSSVVWDEDTYLYANKEEALDRFRKLKEKFIKDHHIDRNGYTDFGYHLEEDVESDKECNVIITFGLGMKET